jgi:hypothetical protein
VRGAARSWDRQQVRSFVASVIRGNRAAWDLVPSLRTAIVAQAYASVVSGQAGETFATAKKLANLWTDMLEAAGLLGEE